MAELRDFRDAAANARGLPHHLDRACRPAPADAARTSSTTAGITGRTSLLFLDAGDARARLKANPWIADATVLKLYPGRLQIAVTERDAFALWQRDGKVEVIADDGTVVEPYAGQPFRQAAAGGRRRRRDPGQGLPGDARPISLDPRPAARRGPGRRAALERHAQERHRRAAAGDRLEQALDTLVTLDRDNKILSRDIAAIDLRLADRVTVRLSDEAAAAREEALKAKNPKKKGGAA